MCYMCGDARSGAIPGTSWFLFRKAVPLLHLSRSLPNCCRQIRQSTLYSHWLSDLSLGFLSLLWSMKAHSFLFSSGSFKAIDTVWSSVVLTGYSPLRSLKRKKKKKTDFPLIIKAISKANFWFCQPEKGPMSSHLCNQPHPTWILFSVPNSITAVETETQL